MTRYIAFLRGINVGGHNVKMDRLRAIFEELSFTAVTTFIASGNVIFESDETNATALEQRIEHALKDALGYEAATFLRTGAELAQIAAYAPFPDLTPKDGDSRYITFFRNAPDDATCNRVKALSNDEDFLLIHTRELYWLRRGSLLDSTIPDKELQKALGKAATTMRNTNTIRRLAAKYPGRAAAA